MSFKSVVKSDSNVEQRVYFVEGSKEGGELRLGGGCSRALEKESSLD